MSTPEEFATLAESYNAGDMAWIAAATVFCWAIIPGIGLLYSGYTNRKNALTQVWISFITFSMGSLSWMTLGYSLTYSGTNPFIGDSALFGHAGVVGAPSPAIPELEYSIFQLVFSVSTIAIFMGGAAERARLSCLPIIAFIWPLIVYSPVAHWTWSTSGWLNKLGAYDFAGGSPVHISSAFGALAFSLYLSNPIGRSKRSKSQALRVAVSHRPHNMLQLVLAYVLICSGWLAFDGGSTLALNLRSFVAMNTTQFSASMGAATWSLLHFIYHHKWSVEAFVSGSIAGLVAITPACGYVGLPASLLIGFTGALGCYYGAKIKYTAFAKRIGLFDPVDCWACHGIGGVIGNLMTGIFAQKSVAATDGASVIKGGWLDGYYRQLGIQMVDCLAVIGWAFTTTYILIFLVDCIPGLEVLATDEEIEQGMDTVGMGESFGEEQWREDEESALLAAHRSEQAMPTSTITARADSVQSDMKSSDAGKMEPSSDVAMVV